MKIIHIESQLIQASLTTHILPILHLEVTIVTPALSPRVLDEPVRDTVFDSIPNSKNSMVHILPNKNRITSVKKHVHNYIQSPSPGQKIITHHGSVAACIAGVNSRLVQSEILDHLKCYADWPNKCNCMLQFFLITLHIQNKSSWIIQF